MSRILCCRWNIVRPLVETAPVVVPELSTDEDGVHDRAFHFVEEPVESTLTDSQRTEMDRETSLRAVGVEALPESLLGELTNEPISRVIYPDFFKTDFGFIVEDDLA